MVLYAIPWTISLVMSILVAIWAESRSPWTVLVIGISIVISFILQTLRAQRQQFISRLAFSIAGSITIVFIVEAFALILR